MKYQGTVQNRRFQLFNRACELLIDNMEIFGPVAHMLQFSYAIGNATQANQRDTVCLTCTQAGKGLHIHHIGINRIIGLAGNDIRTG